MIKLLEGFYLLLRGFFVKVFPRLSGFFEKGFPGFVGMAAVGMGYIGKLWGWVAAYHTIEILRRILLIGLIVFIMDFVLGFVINDLVVFNGRGIHSLFSSLVSTISSYTWGNFLLAFVTKSGLIDAFGIFLTVVLYVLYIRIALSIVFR